MFYSKKLADYIGDISQIGGVKRYTFNSGRAKGVEALDIDNGCGMRYTVIVDRGLDIAHLSYQGIPVSFISKTGIVGPWYYNEHEHEWLRGFTAGFLTTCGLTQAGDPCIFENNSYGLHGLYSNIPADDVSTRAEWVGDNYVMEIAGTIRQVKALFENLAVRRTISTVMGCDKIEIMDSITNESCREEPLMLLYHMNFGYPFLNPDCDIIIPTKNLTGWDEYSSKNTDKYQVITEPDENMPEMTFFHDTFCDGDGMTGFMIANDRENPEIALAVKYDKKILDNLTQWKFLRKKDYVMALEPCNNHVKGVAFEKENGTLKYLKPDETLEVKLDIRFIKGSRDIRNMKEYFRNMKSE